MIAPNIIEQYFAIQKDLCKYFGYVPDWKLIPFDSCTDHYWMIAGPEDSSSTSVVWSTEPFSKDTLKKGSVIYSGTIYTQRFLPKWVYRGEKYTMVAVDTHTDDNKTLMIFDNDKECGDEALKQVFRDVWG